MTIAGYTTDLTDIIDFETSATLNTEVTGYTATAKPTTSGDFPIQGTGHADAEQRATGTGSLVADNGSGVSWTSGDYVFLWGVFLAPAAVDSFANDGIIFYIGSDTSNGYKWTTGGNDFGRYPYGGWQNFVVDPELTTGRTNVGGGAGTTYRWFGILCNVINAISKGSPYGIDVVRYGRGEIITINGDITAYGTFEGMAAENDDNTVSENRWGLFTLQGGSYIWKGLMTLGNATVVDFRDANRNIVIENSINVNSDFNRIEINNASSNVEWSNINISALGTISKGEFEMIDNATVSMNTCIFTDMSTFIFDSNATITSSTFRRCGLVTQGSGTFTGCNFDNSTATYSISADNVSLISGCTFNSDDSNHAIYITAAGSYNLNDCTFNDYATTDGSTGNEVIYNDSGGVVTLNTSGNTGTISIRNGTSASTNIVESVDIVIDIQDVDGNVIEGAQVYIQKTAAGKQYGYSKSDNTKQNYRYASWDTKTFTLNTEVTFDCTGGGTGVLLQDAVNDFTAIDIEEGDTVRNTTDGSWAVVDEITDANNIITSALQGGTDDTWTSGDTYSFHKLALTYTDLDDLVDIPLFNGQTNATGDADTSYNWGAIGAVLPIKVRIRSNNEITKYINYDTTGNITSTGYSLTVTLQEDEVAQ